MASEIKFIDVHSDEIQEIIGRQPAWPVRLGTYCIVGMIISLLLASYYIKYPEVVRGKVIIQSINHPVSLTSGNDKMLVKDILVTNEQQVSSNEILIVFENSANTKDMLFLLWYLRNLDAAKKQNRVISSSLSLKSKLQVGDLQLLYDRFYKEFVKNRYGGIASPLNQKNFEKSISELNTQLLRWKMRYCLVSPVAGRIANLNYLANGSIVTPDQVLLVVVPAINFYEAHAEIPISAVFSQIKTGQTAIIKLDEYPYRQFGSLKAFVNYISDVPVKSNYLVEFRLPNGIHSIKQIPIGKKPELSGTVEIITRDKNIFERLLGRN